MIGITGATGFIGRHLVASLLKQSHSIKVLVSHENYQLPARLNVTIGNLFTGDGVSDFLKGVNVLIHLAARVLPPEEEMYESNVITTQNLLRGAQNNSLQHVIFMSTAAVYGNSPGEVLSEKSKPHPDTEYGRTKLLAERVVKACAGRIGAISTIFRPFNVYGPGNRKGVIYDFYQSAKDRKELIIHGDGHQKRNFLFIDDVVRAILSAIKKKPGGTFNLGDKRDYTIIETAHLFLKILGKDLKLRFSPQEKGKVTEISLDCSLAKKTLEWEATVPFKEGLRRTVKWYQKNI